MDVKKTDPLPAIPGLIIYEQPTHFTGAVTINLDGFESTIPFEGRRIQGVYSDCEIQRPVANYSLARRSDQAPFNKNRLL